ncbi:MAG: DUF3786 domain-containing protein [Deltaproteobacteria bacterium]|jgi:hypothetical protein|nr:DUF3786 domain-containing protein [Deltaproteobacteria bacterium]
MRIDDYKNAIALAVKDLSDREPADVARAAGAEMYLNYMDLQYIFHKVRVKIPGWEAGWAPPRDADELPLTDQVLVYHYLQGAKNVALTGELAAYREIPGGAFYFDAFKRRAEIPLAQVFGSRPGILTKAAELSGGEIRKGYGDEAALFRVFPHVEILIMIHLADEEFEAAGQVLFDRSIGSYLSPEDISWLGSGLVYRLMGVAKGLKD